MMKKLFINGEWLEAVNYASLYSPYSEKVIAEIPVASEEEVDHAISSAYTAKSIMAKMPAHQRARILEKLSQLLEERVEEAAKIIALEAAKPISFARTE